MNIKSVKSKLLLTLTGLIIGTGVMISFAAAYRYSGSLYEATILNAEHLSHQLALEAIDKILLNDLVALQKLVDTRMEANPQIVYLFVVRDDQILAHTFADGFPVQLLGVNRTKSEGLINRKTILSSEGDRIVDFAQPIFGGKAGTLRLGLSAAAYRDPMTRFWMEMALLMLMISLIGHALSRMLIRRITDPLSALAGAVESFDQHHTELVLPDSDSEEIATLTRAFRRMVARIRDRTRSAEEKTRELDRLYQQTRHSFEIVQDIGAQSNLQEMCAYLMRRFQGIIGCQEMIMLFFLPARRSLAVSTEEGLAMLTGKAFDRAAAAIGPLESVATIRPDFLQPPVVPEHFLKRHRQVICPIRHEKQTIGALVIACTGNCQCDGKGLEIVQFIFRQTERVLNRAVLQEEEIRNLQARIESSSEFAGIVGRDRKMKQVYQLIEDIAPSDATVLIQGESGTGKELVANAIHVHSTRAEKPFVVINCSAFPTTLLESELFGHVKGAFTGALRDRDGRFAQADGGTVFLDEIGEISPSAQIKLLRVLQTQKFEPVGGNHSVSVDVRILAASNRELIDEVRQGRFREDLFYRLNVIPVILPPLRERRNDIPLLAQHFLKQFSFEQEKDVTDFSSGAMRALLEYPWPGNVRELENSIEHAVVLAKSTHIEIADLPAEIQKSREQKPAAPPAARRKKMLVENEKKLLQEVLYECRWNKKEAAIRLGISRSTLYEKIKRYQISKPTFH